VISFSLTNISISFQALINDIFREYLDIFVVAYLDDILIYLTNEKDYIKQVNLVLKTLEKAGMKINEPKCTFYTRKIEFLDYIVGSDGIKIDPKKVQAVKDWPILRNMTEVQKFMRFANFYRQFIKNYLGIATLLTDLIRKDRTFT
jgi:Reverse transcriptase (RNA-dependent DNA polymerase)